MNKKFALAGLAIAILLLNTLQIYAQQNQNYTETRIEIKVAGELSSVQKAKINELLNYFEAQNPKLKIESKIKGIEREDEGRETKAGKYHFIQITVSALVIIFALWAVTRIKKEKKYGINLSNNIFAGLTFLFVALSGILLIYDYKIQGFDVKFWHVIVALILLFAIVFHFITHWATWLSYFKKIFRLQS